ncbi:cysteine-rich and transmembrane domain-containing protein 1-like isoform X2 [Takifugu rubripes]|uniref:cysteine-rich and transmembrane domain-containing protein 1-like isoform X2 n=1 Tax=Takifugu rubripes TaxID=31033 RepID=UPI00114565A9|nr:cysteine-rich and transmembrane domain-containing protein 1-like isoform X2 [Takifugu rubripes]
MLLPLCSTCSLSTLKGNKMQNNVRNPNYPPGPMGAAGPYPVQGQPPYQGYPGQPQHGWQGGPPPGPVYGEPPNRDPACVPPFIPPVHVVVEDRREDNTETKIQAFLNGCWMVLRCSFCLDMQSE